MSGRVIIEYRIVEDSLMRTVEIDLGAIKSISDTVTKRTSATPIVTQMMQNAFPIEGANSHSVAVRFVRKNPQTPNDSSTDSRKWSNAYWYIQLSKAIDRWQARTDGCMLRYSGGETRDVPNFDYNGYIKSIDRSYDVEFNEVITGTLNFTVGRMSVNDPSGPPPEGALPIDNMEVLISDPSEANWFVLYAGPGYDCISSMVKSAGPEEDSIEVLTIEIPKKRLEEFAPGLTFQDGKNRVKSSLLGDHTGILVQSKTTKTKITLKIYAEAYIYRTKVLDAPMYGDPVGVITTLLSDTRYGFRYDLVTNTSTGYGMLNFREGTSLWRVMQICAIYANSKLFFADDKAYLVDYCREPTEYIHEKGWMRIEGEFDAYKSNMVVGEMEFDEEGSDPLVNHMVIKCSDAEGEFNTNAEVDVNDSDSVETYGDYGEPSMSVPELTQRQSDPEREIPALSQGMDFANRYIQYRSEPQRSVTFKLREFHCSHGGAYWLPTFPPVTWADGIYDSVSGDFSNNFSTKKGSAGQRVYQKLVLSSYKRSYPEGTTEYTFGTISSIDLSESTSQINNSLGSR